MSFFKHVLLCSLLFIITLQTLSVYNYKALGLTDPFFLNIPYSIGNYGFIPFGKTLVSHIAQSTMNDTTECKPQSSFQNHQNSFLLIHRGKCTFVTKSLNAQKSGARMAIIMDNKEHQNQIVMKDDGNGHRVKIPSIFIHFDHGQKLRQLMNNSLVVLRIAFQNKKTDIVNVVFWLQPYNRRAAKLVEAFKEFFLAVSHKITLDVIYNTKSCVLCMSQDCYNQFKYCFPNVFHQDSAVGQLILDQQIRQQIIFQKYFQKWWDYVKYIDQQCVVISQLKECSQTAMNLYKIQSKEVQSMFHKSFEKPNKKGDNSYLKKSFAASQFAGVIKVPTVTINGQKMNGSIQAQLIFDDICNSLTEIPPECKKYVDNETEIRQKISFHCPWRYCVQLLRKICHMQFCLYRRHLKKKISGEMKSKVDDMVNKYIEFYSERSENKK